MRAATACRASPARTASPRTARAAPEMSAQPDSPAHRELLSRLAAVLPPERLITDRLRRLTWGTDAGFYRLVPQLVVVLDSEAELLTLLEHARELRTPLTFRAAGTS